MDKTTPKKIPKTSVRIWKPLLEEFDRVMEASCLRRDAYLSQLIASEIKYLDEEVAVPNSEAAFAYISQQLERIPRKLITLTLKPEVTERVNAVCREKRIARDAFFNRLFMLLAVPDLIDQLIFGAEGRGYDEPWRALVLDEHKDLFFQRAFQPLEAPTSPFEAIRLGLEIYWRESIAEQGYTDAQGCTWIREVGSKQMTLAPKIYTVMFEHTLLDAAGSAIDLGFMNCYLPDHRIPDTVAHEQHEQSLRALWASVEAHTKTPEFQEFFAKSFPQKSDINAGGGDHED